MRKASLILMSILIALMMGGCLNTTDSKGSINQEKRISAPGIKISDAAVAPNSKFKIKFSGEAIPTGDFGIAGYEILIKYNPEELDLAGSPNESLTLLNNTDNTMRLVNEIKKGELLIAVATTSTQNIISMVGDLFEMEFVSKTKNTSISLERVEVAKNTKNGNSISSSIFIADKQTNTITIK